VEPYEATTRLLRPTHNPETITAVGPRGMSKRDELRAEHRAAVDRLAGEVRAGPGTEVSERNRRVTVEVRTVGVRATEVVRRPRAEVGERAVIEDADETKVDVAAPGNAVAGVGGVRDDPDVVEPDAPQT